MPSSFTSAYLKIERAKKHINNLCGLLNDFCSADSYSVAIDKVDARYKINDLVIDIHTSESAFLSDAALIIGDAVHNLRSALDLLYYEIVLFCGGTPTKWTRFPVRDTGQELVAPLKGALESRQITSAVHDFIRDTVKPYKTGNFPIWAVDEMNVRDKHQLLIPTFQMMGFMDIRIENDEHEIVTHPIVLTEKSCRIRLADSYGRSPVLRDKGRAATGIGFRLGTPYEGEPVTPALNRITEEITRTVKAFELLL